MQKVQMGPITEINPVSACFKCAYYSILCSIFAEDGVICYVYSVEVDVLNTLVLYLLNIVARARSSFRI